MALPSVATLSLVPTTRSKGAFPLNAAYKCLALAVRAEESGSGIRVNSSRYAWEMAAVRGRPKLADAQDDVAHGAAFLQRSVRVG